MTNFVKFIIQIIKNIINFVKIIIQITKNITKPCKNYNSDYKKYYQIL